MNDLEQRITASLRTRLHLASRGALHTTVFPDLCSCTAGELIDRLSERMPPGYSWADYSREKLHIDHCCQLHAWGTLTDPDDAKTAFHFTNLRLLPAAANMARPKTSYKTNSTAELPLFKYALRGN